MEAAIDQLEAETVKASQQLTQLQSLCRPEALALQTRLDKLQHDVNELKHISGHMAASKQAR
jgi:hypothetical protein